MILWDEYSEVLRAAVPEKTGLEPSASGTPPPAQAEKGGPKKTWERPAPGSRTTNSFSAPPPDSSAIHRRVLQSW
jgi:hypothetical protein